MEVPRTLRAEYAQARQPERRPRMEENEEPRWLEVSDEDAKMIAAIVPHLVGMTAPKWRRVKRAVDQAFNERANSVTLAEERVTELLRMNLH